MSDTRWRWFFGVGLVALSISLYGLHYLIFHDPHHIFIFFVHDVAFVPIEVLLVTLIIHELLSRRQKREMMYKMNMIIGVFYHEMGAGLIQRIVVFLRHETELRERLSGIGKWTDADFARAAARMREYSPAFECGGEDFSELRRYLSQKRPFVVRLLENPTLLEHDRLSEILWSVTHIMDELALRPDVDCLASDVGRHIADDLRRAFGLLGAEWLNYLNHLKNDYPYMFESALKLGPFGESLLEGGHFRTEQDRA